MQVTNTLSLAAVPFDLETMEVTGGPVPLVEGLIRMMNTEDDFYGPVNIGNPNEFTILELAKKIIELTKSDSKIIYMPLPQDDPIQRQPDITLAKEKLGGWEPKIQLEEGLLKTIKYFKTKL